MNDSVQSILMSPPIDSSSRSLLGTFLNFQRHVPSPSVLRSIYFLHTVIAAKHDFYVKSFPSWIASPALFSWATGSKMLYMEARSKSGSRVLLISSSKTRRARSRGSQTILPHSPPAWAPAELCLLNNRLKQCLKPWALRQKPLWIL